MIYKAPSRFVTVNGNVHIIYDDQLSTADLEEIFDPLFLESKGLVTGQAPGRGSVYFFRYSEMELVLRHYRRGGGVSKIIKDWYLGRRMENTRAWREYHMLIKMRELNLPVPRPIAVRVQMKKLIYKADLITERIMNAKTFVDALNIEGNNFLVWKKVGQCIRKFHNTGVYHHDLNARNILVDSDMRVHLIDFDRCKFRSGGNWRSRNMFRLQRSLAKISSHANYPFYSDEKWAILIEAYNVG